VDATKDAPDQTTGTITGVVNHGTIVVVLLTTDDDGIVPVHFDHRPFHWLLEAEQCTHDQLIGRSAFFDGGVLSFEG
jgi:hypothetical protein